MPTFVYRCAAHGTQEIDKARDEAGRAEACPVCRSPLRRIYTVAAVQHLGATTNSLMSWGRDERPTRVLKRDWYAAQRRERLEEEAG